MSAMPLRRPKAVRERERELVAPVLAATFDSMARRAHEVHRTLTGAGYRPLRARRDRDGNCFTCGESGRCPGYHIGGRLHEFYKKDGTWQFLSITDHLYRAIPTTNNGWLVTRSGIELGTAQDMDKANELLTVDIMAKRPPRHVGPI